MTDQLKRIYYVSVPIAGSATFEVKATDEKSAITAAWEAACADEEPLIEWEYFPRITTGNVLHAPLNEIEVSRG